MEQEGRPLDKQKESIKLMMNRLQDAPTALSAAREETNKQRRKWAKEHESYGAASNTSSDDKKK